MNANVYFNNVSETLSIENEHYRLRINDHNQLRAQSVHEDHNLVDAPLPNSANTQELRWDGASMVEGPPIQFQGKMESCIFPLF